MERGFTRLKVAAISFKPKKWDKQVNAERIESLFRTAHERGAELAVITEGALEGYVVEDVMHRPELGPRLIEIAEPRNGPFVACFQKLAKSLGMCLCIGFAERVGREAYNAAMFIDHRGKIRGVHHKMQFAEGYDPAWYFARLGKKVSAFETPHGRAGILICNDRWNAGLARSLVLDGAQMIFIPAYGSTSSKQDRAVLQIGRRNGIPVVEANVGANLIVSEGEVAAHEKGIDRVTICDIQIPASQSFMLLDAYNKHICAGEGKR